MPSTSNSWEGERQRIAMEICRKTSPFVPFSALVAWPSGGECEALQGVLAVRGLARRLLKLALDQRSRPGTRRGGARTHGPRAALSESCVQCFERHLAPPAMRPLVAFSSPGGGRARHG